MTKSLVSFFKGFVILEIVNKSLAMILIWRDISNVEKVMNKKHKKKNRKREKEIKGCLDS